jgi:hypothetical protein
MRKYIYKPMKGKDFYRNSLEYFEYNPDEEDLDIKSPKFYDNEEIGYYISTRIQ